MTGCPAAMSLFLVIDPISIFFLLAIKTILADLEEIGGLIEGEPMVFSWKNI